MDYSVSETFNEDDKQMLLEVNKNVKKFLCEIANLKNELKETKDQVKVLKIQETETKNELNILKVMNEKMNSLINDLSA